MGVLLFGHKIKKSVGSKVPNVGGKGYKKSVAGDDNGTFRWSVWLQKLWYTVFGMVEIPCDPNRHTYRY